jgi:hypothetical protein
MNEPRFEVFPEMYDEPDEEARCEPTGEFVWHFQDANGRITFTGGESFTRREDAHRSIEGAAIDVAHMISAGVTDGHIRKFGLIIVDLDENDNVIEADQ